MGLWGSRLQHGGRTFARPCLASRGEPPWGEQVTWAMPDDCITGERGNGAPGLPEPLIVPEAAPDRPASNPLNHPQLAGPGSDTHNSHKGTHHHPPSASAQTHSFLANLDAAKASTCPIFVPLWVSSHLICLGASFFLFLGSCRLLSFLHHY